MSCHGKRVSGAGGVGAAGAWDSCVRGVFFAAPDRPTARWRQGRAVEQSAPRANPPNRMGLTDWHEVHWADAAALVLAFLSFSVPPTLRPRARPCLTVALHHCGQDLPLSTRARSINA